MDRNLRNARFKVENQYPAAEFEREGTQWRLVSEGRELSGLHDTIEEALYEAAHTLPGPYTRPARTARKPPAARAWSALRGWLRAPLVPVRALFHRES